MALSSRVWDQCIQMRELTVSVTRSNDFCNMTYLNVFYCRHHKLMHHPGISMLKLSVGIFDY